jgi:hypothetical protein
MWKTSAPGSLDEFAREHRWLGWATCAFACLIIAIQLLASVHQLSQTADESTHLYAGYREWKCGDFGVSPEHPPLARLLGAIPFVLAEPNANCADIPPSQEAFASLDWLYATPHWERLLFEARALVSLFAIGLCVLVWVAARRMFGYTAALVATSLLVFEPNILAHGALVTTDMVLACMFLFAIFAFYLWTGRRTVASLLLAALATGLTLTAKQSGAIVVPILFLLAISDPYLQSAGSRPRWKQALKNVYETVLICALAAGVVWTMYGLRFAARADGTHLPTTIFYRGSLGNVLLAVRSAHLLPESYLEGLQTARVLARESGNPVFLLGKTYPTGRWYFFPVAMLIKFTVPTLMLFLLAATAAVAVYKRHRREVLFVMLPGLAFLAACMSARMNSGIRHALPVVPFVLIFIGAGATQLIRQIRWAPKLLFGAVVLHAVSSLHSFPSYLSYANEFWGGPAKAYAYMPNNDWGESFKEVKTYLDERHSQQPCWIASVYLMDAKNYGVPCHQFGGWLSKPVPPHINGTVIVSSVFLSTFRNAAWLNTFQEMTPAARIGGSSMLVYKGSFDTRELTTATEISAAKRMMWDGNVTGAMQHARRAVEIMPEDSTVHFEYCRALVANGAIHLARQECEVARAFALKRGRDLYHWDSFDGIDVLLHAVDIPAPGSRK